MIYFASHVVGNISLDVRCFSRQLSVGALLACEEHILHGVVKAIADLGRCVDVASDFLYQIFEHFSSSERCDRQINGERVPFGRPVSDPDFF